MKTTHKLILKAYLGPMIVTFFIVMFVLLMQYMWRYIDELVGKGLGLDVIAELMFYASITLIPMGLPLATLLASIMTLGNMGEHNELLALKSAGISLPRILKPLAILILFISIGSFFVANNLVPMASRKMIALLYDIRQQKHTIEFKDGLFFNSIENISIRVGRQDPQTGLLTDVLIYDTRNTSGDMMTTLADSGYISLSDDKRFLLITLYNGEAYEESRSYKWYENSTLRHNIFEVQNMILPLSGFNLQRSDESLFGMSGQTKNVRQLSRGIDSLQTINDSTMKNSYTPLLRAHLFEREPAILSDTGSFASYKTDVNINLLIDSLTLDQRKSLYSIALSNARSARSYYSFDEVSSKDTLTQLYRHKVEWHRKLSLPVSIMIFFLIGAPLGAIIRKGGLGTPIVVSVSFFVIYYIISITGEKMALEGTWQAFQGMWISTYILFPIAIYLTYKATNDSNLLNAEWYFIQFKKFKAFCGRILPKHRKGPAVQ